MKEIRNLAQQGQHNSDQKSESPVDRRVIFGTSKVADADGNNKFTSAATIDSLSVQYSKSTNCEVSLGTNVRLTIY